MKTSTLTDHILEKKKGKISSPWNYSLGNLTFLTSWSRNRLPEYLWLILILKKFGRDEGLRLAGEIFKQISNFENRFKKPKFSTILSFEKDAQEKIFNIISKFIEPNCLSPLSSVLSQNENILFNQIFSHPGFTIQKKLNTIIESLNECYLYQSEFATDICFLVVSNQVYQNAIFFGPNAENASLAIQNYLTTKKSDENYGLYGSIIRCIEGGCPDEVNQQFISSFWINIGMRTDCRAIIIKQKTFENVNQEFISDFQNILEFFLNTKKSEFLQDPKFQIFLSLANFAYKIFHEILKNNLGRAIVGRFSLRTLIEVFIVLKYLVLISADKPTVWTDYKRYGIGKYKLILLKARNSNIESDSHVSAELLDIIVNEEIWEEFTDIDLKYFEQTNIREKSKRVNEKELFDLLYDYDSNFSHALWGAIRESSMLKCLNPGHQFHVIPDISNAQDCNDVLPDSFRVVKKILYLFNDHFCLPEWFILKYK